METVVALTIVAVTAVSALGAVAADLRVAERARRAIEAEALATQRLALLDLVTEPELLALPDSVAEGAFDAPFGEYRWETSAEARDADRGVYDVSVRVTWPGGAYAVRSAVYRRPNVLAR